jgi:hypothetical protein
MTLGVGVTSNEPVNGWESLMPDTLSASEKAYREQRDIADEMERRHNEMVEDWIAVGNYDAMFDNALECNKARERAYELSHQRYCTHDRAHVGETYCPDCNKRLED